jgi:hypothetical protein
MFRKVKCRQYCDKNCSDNGTFSFLVRNVQVVIKTKFKYSDYGKASVLHISADIVLSWLLPVGREYCSEC